MTLPSKATESSLSIDFRHCDLRDTYPDDYAVENLLYSRGDEHRMSSKQNHVDADHHMQSQEDAKTCRVCGDAATGMYFGALVCVPCKTFFLRYAGDGFSYECKFNKDCEVSIATRTQCKYCRYQKCLRVGMCRRVRPAQVEAQDGQQLCVVCKDVANGVHFGVLTCEGCKKFFRRGLTEQKSYRCRNNQNCSINPSNRNTCRFCRFQKCLRAGMSREAIQMGRPSKMSLFENVHHRPQTKDPEKALREPKSDPHPTRGPSILKAPPSGTSGAFEVGLDYSGRGQQSSEDRRVTSGGIFPPWMEAPLMVAPGEGGRAGWNQYDSLSNGKPGWPMGVLSFMGKYSPSKATSDEGEKSEGSACPDSTMVREEADPFLPVDYTSMQRSLVSDDYFQDWTEEMRDNFRHDASQHLASGFREASPVAMATAKCKLEVLSSDDEGLSGYKRARYDGQAQGQGQDQGQGRSRDCLLSQGCFDVVNAPLGGLQNPNFRHSVNGDVTSSELVTRVGESGGAFGEGVFHSSCPTVPMDVDGVLPSGSATCATRGQSVGTDAGIGSPSVSSSSGHPLDAVKMERSEVQKGGLTMTQFLQWGESSHKGNIIAASDGASDRSESEVSMKAAPDLPLEEVGNQCWHTIKRVIPSYHRFVTAGTAINHQLKEAHEAWKRENPKSDSADELSFWIQTTVVPAYTTASVAYCKCLPDFTDLNPADQRILIAGGQSQSRILVAALHWYDAGEKRFRNFLSWRADTSQRPDSFKVKLRDFADHITKLHLDPIEAALLNALGVFSTDYRNLHDKVAVEANRNKILTTMKSYITANNSAPSDRLESLCKVLKEAQVLGAEHVALTNTRTLGLPDSSDEVAGQVLTTGQALPTSRTLTTNKTPSTGQAMTNVLTPTTGQSQTIGHIFITGQTMLGVQPLTIGQASTYSDSGTQVGHQRMTEKSVSNEHQTEDPTGGQSKGDHSPIRQLPADDPPDHSPGGEIPADDSLNGHSPMDHLPSGHLTSDHPPRKHLPVDHSPSGHVPAVHSPTGQLPADHSPNGHLRVDHLPSDHLPTDHSSSGQLQVDCSPDGHLPIDHSPSGHLTDEHSLSGHLTDDHPPSGHLTDDHPPGGHLPDDHSPSGHLSDDHSPRGHLSDDHSSGGQLPADHCELDHGHSPADPADHSFEGRPSKERTDAVMV